MKIFVGLLRIELSSISDEKSVENSTNEAILAGCSISLNHVNYNGDADAQKFGTKVSRSCSLGSSITLIFVCRFTTFAHSTHTLTIQWISMLVVQNWRLILGVFLQNTSAMIPHFKSSSNVPKSRHSMVLISPLFLIHRVSEKQRIGSDGDFKNFYSRSDGDTKCIHKECTIIAFPVFLKILWTACEICLKKMI